MSPPTTTHGVSLRRAICRLTAHQVVLDHEQQRYVCSRCGRLLPRSTEKWPR